MILRMYTIFDSKAEVYLQPFCMKAKGEAIRAFADHVNDGQSQFSKHPEDFTLFELGEFDDCKACINMHHTPISMGVAVEFKTQQANAA